MKKIDFLIKLLGASPRLRQAASLVPVLLTVQSPRCTGGEGVLARIIISISIQAGSFCPINKYSEFLPVASYLIPHDLSQRLLFLWEVQVQRKTQRQILAFPTEAAEFDYNFQKIWEHVQSSVSSAALICVTERAAEFSFSHDQSCATAARAEVCGSGRACVSNAASETALVNILAASSLPEPQWALRALVVREHFLRCLLRPISAPLKRPSAALGWFRHREF